MVLSKRYVSIALCSAFFDPERLLSQKLYLSLKSKVIKISTAFHRSQKQTLIILGVFQYADLLFQPLGPAHPSLHTLQGNHIYSWIDKSMLYVQEV